MANWRYRVYWPSSIGGALNPAIVSFGLTSNVVLSPEYAAHRLAAYCQTSGSEVSGASSISQILFSFDGGPERPVAWDEDIWDEIVANQSSSHPVSSSMTYGFEFGSGSMTIRGASVNMAEYTELGGKHNGRHYLPWIDAAALDTSGDLKATSRTYLVGAWNFYVKGDPDESDPWNCYLGPWVPTGSAGTPSLITDVTARPVVSRLRSRTR